MSEKPRAPELTHNDIRRCGVCKGPVAGRLEDGVLALHFHRVTVETAVLDPHAINSRAGLTSIFGGSPAAAALAEVFAPTRHIAKVSRRTEVLVCVKCSARHGLDVFEASSDRVSEYEVIGR